MTGGASEVPMTMSVNRMILPKLPMQIPAPDRTGECPGHFSIAFPTALVYTGDAHPLHQGKLGAIIARIPELFSNTKGATS
jgi:hypothetical protein